MLAAENTESHGSYGSKRPSLLPSCLYFSQVAGINCIKPAAPASEGPMSRPKPDSVLQIAASTAQDTPYFSWAFKKTGRDCEGISTTAKAVGAPERKPCCPRPSRPPMTEMNNKRNIPIMKAKSTITAMIAYKKRRTSLPSGESRFNISPNFTAIAIVCRCITPAHLP